MVQDRGNKLKELSVHISKEFQHTLFIIHTNWMEMHLFVTIIIIRCIKTSSMQMVGDLPDTCVYMGQVHVKCVLNDNCYEEPWDCATLQCCADQCQHLASDVFPCVFYQYRKYSERILEQKKIKTLSRRSSWVFCLPVIQSLQ